MNKNFIFITLFICSILFPQYDRATTDIDLRQIKEGDRYLVDGLNEKIKTYIETTTFASDADDLGLDVTIKLLIQSIQNKGSSHVLSVQAIFSSNNNYFYSKKTSFPYSQGVQLINNGQYNPIRSFFDYYLYLLIAMDLDTWDYMGGESYYNKSIEISKLGEGSEYSSGWNDRRDTADKLKTNRFLRNLKYQFFIALDEAMKEKSNSKIIKSSLIEMNQEINSIEKVYGDEKYTMMFLDNHARDVTFLCNLIGYDELLYNLVLFNEKNRDIYEGTILDE